MNQSLEDMINRKKRPNFKSKGERQIAYFLDSNSIKYEYEPAVLINSLDRKLRIWYPDFYLSEFASFIEYYGLAGCQDYDHGIHVKQKTYSAMGMDVISIYPWTFLEDWQQYIMKELERITTQRYKSLMSKPYWWRKRPTQ